MQAVILSIGDELTSGQTLNTNSSWLAQQLSLLGISTLAHITVGDALEPTAAAIRQSLEQLDLAPEGLLIITGGLGPTEDDLTRQALADALHEQLVEDPDAVLQIERFFQSVNRPMSPSNRLQALRPHSAIIIENTAGTAPGLRATKNRTHIFVFPGVPREMKAMFHASLLPFLQSKTAGNITLVTKLNTFGRGESIIGENIRDLMTRTGIARNNAHASVGTTAHDGVVSVRIYATGPEPTARALTDELAITVRSRLGDLIFSTGEEPLESAVANLLKQSRLTLATAESCTGGLLATLLTNIPGSSEYFLRGWVTYANAAKHDELQVPENLLTQHGAVSEPVARAMAQGAKKFAQSNFALATTGIAGPDGGTPEKPVGTVWIAIAGPDSDAVFTKKIIFPGDRQAIRLRASQMALALLRWKLLNANLPI